jgi:universal stress protein A
MFPIKKILCPTDFSEPAAKGLEAALELAEKFSAELVLAHVILPSEVTGSIMAVAGTAADGFNTPLNIQRLENNASERMQKLAHERIPARQTFRFQVLFGRPAEEISRLAEEEAVDLIVMATHGESGWGRIFFGSVAEKVVRLAECPVLTVKQPRK